VKRVCFFLFNWAVINTYHVKIIVNNYFFFIAGSDQALKGEVWGDK
jgi:hypothetical protein